MRIENRARSKRYGMKVQLAMGSKDVPHVPESAKKCSGACRIPMLKRTDG